MPLASTFAITGSAALGFELFVIFLQLRDRLGAEFPPTP
jgi:hypothetical protein